MTTRAPDSAHVLRQLQAVAEETRFEIVRLLSEGERCVCELQEALGGAAQSRLSFHLKRLKDAEVVSDRREGRWVYYSLVPQALEGIRAFLGDPTPREPWEAERGGGRPTLESDHRRPTASGGGSCC
jgi:ArsR family transcriptional regulator